MGFSHRESRVAPTSLILLPPKENKSRQIRQFHFHGWPEVGIPSDGKGMISIIAAVQKQQQQSGNHPITVHCRYAHPSPQGEERERHERQAEGRDGSLYQTLMKARQERDVGETWQSSLMTRSGPDDKKGSWSLNSTLPVLGNNSP